MSIEPWVLWAWRWLVVALLVLILEALYDLRDGPGGEDA